MEQLPSTDRALTLAEAVSIAISMQQSEQWLAAADIYRRVLEVSPDYPEAVHYSGVLAHQSGRSETIASIRDFPQAGSQVTASIALSVFRRSSAWSTAMNHWSVARKMVGLWQRQQCG